MRNTVYLAARYSRNAEMRAIRDTLHGLGYQITSRWIETPEGRYGSGSFTRDQLRDDPEYCAKVAERDFEDVAAASTLIAFTEADGGGKGGRHVELGFALALARYGRSPVRVIICGPREHVFHTAEGTEWYPGVPELIEALNQEQDRGMRPRPG